MFRLGNYKVQFRYEAYYGLPDGICGRRTVCEIEDISKVPPESSIIVACADCSPHDQFDRNVGRKIALARALTVIPRAERAAYWEAYHKARGKW